MKNRLLSILKIAISAGLLFLLSRLFDFGESLTALRGMELRYGALAFLLFQCTLLLRSYRWRAFLVPVGVDIPIHRLLYLYYVGVFFNTFLPSGFGGDAVKMYELARFSRKGAESVGTVLLDRLAGIIVLFVMGLVAWPFAVRILPKDTAGVLLAVSLAGLLMIWLMFRQRLIDPLLRFVPGGLGRQVQGLYRAVHTSGSTALGRALAISAVFNVILFLASYSISRSISLDIPLIYFVIFMPILSLSMMIPSIGALGTREGAYVLLFGAVGVSAPDAMAMSLAFYLINVATGLIGVILYMVEALRGASRKGSPKDA